MIQNRKLNVLLESVKKLVRRNDYKHVTNILRKIHSADIAYVLNSLMEPERVRLVNLLTVSDTDLAAEAISELDDVQGAELLTRLPVDLGVRILQAMESDDAANLISTMPDDHSQKILELMNAENVLSVKDLLQYEEETAGRIMNSDVFALQDHLTVGEAVRAVQEKRDTAAMFYLYVVDERNHLVGVLSLKHLLLHPSSTPLRRIMRTNVISVNVETDQEEVARQVANYNLLAIPVVDETNKLAGVITVDDIIDVIKEEATEDIFYLAGVEADDHTYSPSKVSIKKRIPWLITYLCIGLLTAWVISLFKGTLDSYVILALFMPLVGGMAGNAGNQTMTVTVRGLAVGELVTVSKKKFFLKEIRVGLVNGFFLGILASLISGTLAYVWGGNEYVGVVMFFAMWINITLASIWGTLIPLTLKWFKIDPALASGIFVSTLNDVFGFTIFLGLATILFKVFGI